MKRLAMILFAVGCFCVATLLGAVAEAQLLSRRVVVTQQSPPMAYTYHPPAVTYYVAPVETRNVESTVSVRHDSLQTGAQRRHARKAEEHIRKASRWASRS